MSRWLRISRELPNWFKERQELGDAQKSYELPGEAKTREVITKGLQEGKSEEEIIRDIIMVNEMHYGNTPELLEEAREDAKIIFDDTKKRLGL